MAEVTDVENPVAHMAWTWGSYQWTADMNMTTMVNHIKETARVLGWLDWIFQFEKGQGGFCHFQGYCHVGTPKQRPTPWGAMMQGPMPGIHVSPSSTTGINALKNYCMKTDNTKVSGPWAKDMDKLAKKLKELAIKELPEYKGEDRVQLEQMTDLQKAIIEEVTTQQPDQRRVIYIWDQLGHTGKSAIADHLCFKHDACLVNWMEQKDLLEVMREAAERRCKIYIFDLERTKPAHVNEAAIYNVIEQLKCGRLCVPKYNSKTFWFPKPHVVVFSNQQPSFQYLTQDRFFVLQTTKEDVIPKDTARDNIWKLRRDTKFKRWWTVDGDETNKENELNNAKRQKQISQEEELQLDQALAEYAKAQDEPKNPFFMHVATDM